MLDEHFCRKVGETQGLELAFSPFKEKMSVYAMCCVFRCMFIDVLGTNYRLRKHAKL